jgi:hypothetical protein
MRGMAGQFIGPIPWRAIRDYGCWLGLEPDMIDHVLHPIIRIMDYGFLQNMRGEYEKESRRQASQARRHRPKEAPKRGRRRGGILRPRG